MAGKAERDPFEVQRWESFGIPGIDVQLRKAITDQPRPGVPKLREDYVLRGDLLRELAWCAWPPDDGDPVNLLLSGPKGSGKTSLVEQVAARCNIPVYRINMNVGTTVRHLKGRVGADTGRTVFIPGVVTLAMEQGAWLLMDEISAATPPVSLSLFPVLEPDGRVLLEDAQPPRYVRRHADFRVFATDNTLGAAQEENRFSYAGTNPDANEALLDRFGGMIEVGYLDPKDEYAAVLGRIPLIDADVLEGMVTVANEIRHSNEFPTGFSTRMLLDWARRVASGYRCADGSRAPEPDIGTFVLHCAEAAFLRRQRTGVERAGLEEVIRRMFAVRQ